MQENEGLVLELKEDTVDVEFKVRVVDNRLPGIHIVNDGGDTFSIFYTKRSGLLGKPKEFFLDHFKVAYGRDRLTYEEAVSEAKNFFSRYMRSKVLQRVYAAKIMNF